jgi:predicted transcriptional regulator of viral defense system
MQAYNKVKDWVDDLPKRGKVTFSQEEVINQFPQLSLTAIRSSLYRCIEKNKIQSVWHGFFAIVLAEYGIRGIVPPIEYIDQLMKYLGKDYYIALLNAAELYGAAHHAPQDFFVMSNTTNLRNKIKKDVKINFVAKKNISQKHLTQITTNNGSVNVSSPELTAYDLICYMKNIGGINRAATIINDLAGKIRFTNVNKEFLLSFAPAVTQRLGYIFEELGFEELADKLYRKAEIAGLKYRKIPLVIVDKTKDLSKYPVSKRWKLIINEQLDIDE